MVGESQAASSTAAQHSLLRAERHKPLQGRGLQALLWQLYQSPHWAEQSYQERLQATGAHLPPVS